MSEETTKTPEELEIEASQAQLGNALARARMGEDQDLATRVREDGERFVRILYGLLKMTELHDLQNNAFEKPIIEFIETGESLMELLGAIHLVTVEDQVFLNDIRIRFGRAQTASTLSQEFSHHLVGGLSFHAMPKPSQMLQLISLLAGESLGDPPRAALITRFGEVGLDFIDLLGVYRFRISGEGTVPIKKSVDKISAKAANLVDESWDNLSSDRMPNPLRLRRAVTELLDSESSDVSGLATEGTKSGFGAHTTQVCRLALIIAKAANLSEEAVQDLGVTAMFHDMGYAAREGADPDKGEEGFPPPFERHASAGARILLKQRGFTQAKIYRALATLESHTDYDSEPKPSVFGRIIRIAEDYSNLIRYDGGGMNPHEALGRMMAAAGKYYDPDLMQVFVNAMGKYPPGTLLEVEIDLKGRTMKFILMSNSLARDPDSFDKPMCRLVRLHDGRDAPPQLANRAIDLAKKGKIIRVVNDF